MKNDIQIDNKTGDQNENDTDRSDAQRRSEALRTKRHRFNFLAYALALDAVRKLTPVMNEIARHDANLADQGRRALPSMPLDLAEGAESSGKLRLTRYRNALASSNEVIAVLDVAEALGYVRVTFEQRDSVEHVRAVVLNLVRPKR